jgi:hypothetical protein
MSFPVRFLAIAVSSEDLYIVLHNSEIPDKICTDFQIFISHRCSYFLLNLT